MRTRKQLNRMETYLDVICGGILVITCALWVFVNSPRKAADLWGMFDLHGPFYRWNPFAFIGLMAVFFMGMAVYKWEVVDGVSE